ncbi:hypothetical protein [Deinococcus multiflagellatus]|uniref:Uncharacterized protein n=1 Tax=Deinococcus multiflagellatus TaxID=1656887 RepID=A0ABW1ZRL9_9DEIO|nr:hypothetical protein [Deinococcus multiflagellatus]MBZ9715488.1 hypothetical protein [Deinococcus multiflagellatus]
MPEGRHDVSLGYKSRSALPGGLGKNTDAGLLPGKQIRFEAHTNLGEAAILTSARLLLMHVGLSNNSIGKIDAFGFCELIDVTFQECGFIKKFYVIYIKSALYNYESTIADQVKEIEKVSH